MSLQLSVRIKILTQLVLQLCPLELRLGDLKFSWLLCPQISNGPLLRLPKLL